MTATGGHEDSVVSDGAYHFSDEEASGKFISCASLSINLFICKNNKFKSDS